MISVVFVLIILARKQRYLLEYSDFVTLELDEAF